MLDNYVDLAEVVSTEQIDVALWTEEQARTWVMLHPGYAAIIPARLAFQPVLAFAYLVPNNATHFLRYLNYWLKLKTLDGFQQQEYQQWLLAKEPISLESLWNIIDTLMSK